MSRLPERCEGVRQSSSKRLADLFISKACHGNQETKFLE
jgi:hypothetical protein